jgi:hypothetical protein
MPDIPYIRPNRTRQYLSISKHQFNSSNNHSKWLSFSIETKTFDTADYGNFTLTVGSISWTDSNGNLWGFLNDFPDLGTSKQQFGYFENPNNLSLSWHGFPIIPFSAARYKIDDELLERWVHNGVLDRDDIPAIKQRKRI